MTGPEKIVLIRSIVLTNDCFTSEEWKRVMEILSGPVSEACVNRLVERCLYAFEKEGSGPQ